MNSSNCNNQIVEASINMARQDVNSSNPLHFLRTVEPSEWNKQLDIIEECYGSKLVAFDVVHNPSEGFSVLVAKLTDREIVSTVFGRDFKDCDHVQMALWNLETISSIA